MGRRAATEMVVQCPMLHRNFLNCKHIVNTAVHLRISQPRLSIGFAQVSRALHMARIDHGSAGVEREAFMR